MFEESFRGFCDLVLPGTSYLERDGTTVNLEGRLQRQRRAVIAPCPDELAWIAKLAERFGVELSPHASLVFDEVSAICYGGISFGEVGEHAALPARPEAVQPLPNPPAKKLADGRGAAAPHLPAALLRRPRSTARPSSRSSGPSGEIELAPRRRARPRDRHRRHGHVSARTAPRSRCARGSRATCRPASARMPRRRGRGPARARRGEQVTHPHEVWWISLIKVARRRSTS